VTQTSLENDYMQHCISMQCCDVNPGGVQKAESHPWARGVKHVN